MVWDRLRLHRMDLEIWLPQFANTYATCVYHTPKLIKGRKVDLFLRVIWLNHVKSEITIFKFKDKRGNLQERHVTYYVHNKADPTFSLDRLKSIRTRDKRSSFHCCFEGESKGACHDSQQQLDDQVFFLPFWSSWPIILTFGGLCERGVLHAKQESQIYELWRCELIFHESKSLWWCVIGFQQVYSQPPSKFHLSSRPEVRFNLF